MAGWQDDPVVQPAAGGWQADAVVAPPQTDAEKVNAYRVAGQFGRNANQSFVNGVTSPLDLYGSFAKWVGLASPDTPTFSSVYGQAMDDLASLPLRIKDAVSQGSFDPIFASRDTYNSRVNPGAPQNRAERLAADTGSAVGTVASSVIPGTAMADAAKAGSTTALVGNALKANPIAQTGLTAAGNIASSETGSPYVGAGVQLAAPLLFHGAQRTFSAAPAADTQEAERRALLEYGRQNNLGPLTAGKITGNPKIQAFESATSKIPLPFVGGRVASTEQQSRNAFQRFALEKAGTTGETAVTPDVLARTSDRIGNMFDAFKGQTIKVDPQFGNDLATAKADFSKQLESQIPQSIMSKIDDLAKAPAAVTPGNKPGETLPVVAGTPQSNAYLDGETFQNIRSKLSGMLGRASGTDAQALRKMINAMDDLAERQLPSDVVGDYKQARQQWRNYLALKASVAANNDQTAVGNMSTAAFGRAARDNPDLVKLAQYGNAFVGDKAANTSRTAAHNVANKMMEGGPLAALAGGYAAYKEGLLNAHTLPYAATAAAAPYLVSYGLNNPATRAALLARYRNPTPSLVKPSLVGANLLDALKGLGR